MGKSWFSVSGDVFIIIEQREVRVGFSCAEETRMLLHKESSRRKKETDQPQLLTKQTKTKQHNRFREEIISFMNLNSVFFWHMESERYKRDLQTSLSQCMTGGLGNVQML